MTRKLFGTDGVRGVAGEFLSAELALALGRAATAQTAVARIASANRRTKSGCAAAQAVVVKYAPIRKLGPIPS